MLEVGEGSPGYLAQEPPSGPKGTAWQGNGHFLSKKQTALKSNGDFPAPSANFSTNCLFQTEV